MTSNDIEKRIREFSDKTIEAFYFLEKEYGYNRKKLKRNGFKDPRDAEVYIRYFGKKVAVEITWAIGASAVAVGLYELQGGKIPDQEKVSFYGHEGFSRAINLDSLVRMLTAGKINSPLPEYAGNISFAEIDRRVKTASDMIKTDIGGILKILAERLKKYASNILKGDTSIFQQVQKHHREYWDVEI